VISAPQSTATVPNYHSDTKISSKRDRITNPYELSVLVKIFGRD